MKLIFAVKPLSETTYAPENSFHPSPNEPDHCVCQKTGFVLFCRHSSNQPKVSFRHIRFDKLAKFCQQQC